MQPPASSLLRRPNGRPQACEPCRKRKVACDHSQPVCNRCRKRSQGNDCVYLVSGNSRTSSAPRRPPPSPTGSTPSVIYLPSTTNVSETTEIRSPEGLSARQMASGYLGFTSFSAVFEETQNSLSRLKGSHATPPESEDLNPETSVPDGFTLSTRAREACLYVLRQVPEPSRGKFYLRGSPCEAWYYYFLDRVLTDFYETFGEYFGPNRNDKSLEELAIILCRNTALPFSDDEDISPSQWIAQFSGSKTRWEALGLIFGFWDFSVNSITIVKNPNHDEYGRPSQITKQCVDFCLELCNEFSPANSMLLFLTHKRLVMETVLNGDMSRRSWLFLGEVITLLTFLGYHVLPDTPDYQPNFMTEIKRRIYYSIYNVHMTMVSLTGRPLLMTQNYNTTPLPLDIGNSTLYGVKGISLDEAKADINNLGWNKRESRFSVSFLRARAKLSMLREELMHFALHTKQQVTVDELLDVKARELRTIEDFPPFMEYRDSDLDDQKHDVNILYWKLLMRLEHLLNMFFIERLLLKHGHSQSDILSISFDMITYTLPFWTHQDTLLPLRNDCEWLVIAFGVPAGGILCQELLKPTLHNDSRITRSSLIQKLSLLVGFLDWVKPTAPNGDQCSKCKTIIKHVLDQALNASPPGYESAPGAVYDLGFTTQVDFDFDLLNTFDWARSEPSWSQQTNA
ncbi:hypothetical protein F5B22DRAFT_658920 [Xylaria bambusicola]|uniref:uncharacterized protein n=1 Tax=Xylaria bambusicola TaxID=326684 RepID=UPI0020083667|nr:uncharacterized protein F5B22DRAFT_658920 [Xylaria bambusicola]KAI0508806.1 hypothetical protein F5B22DRAFT_658920 [Xylaria bambusicola]